MTSIRPAPFRNADPGFTASTRRDCEWLTTKVQVLAEEWTRELEQHCSSRLADVEQA